MLKCRYVNIFYNFSEDSIPEKLSVEMVKTIEQLKQQASSSDNFLKLTYDFIGSKYRSERFNTVLKFGYLLRIFLITSGWFKEEDIRRKHLFVNFVPHQYLQVKVNGEWIDIDVGEKRRGLPLGRHLKYFG